MRDIRDGLRERLAALQSERDRLKGELAALDQHEQPIRRVLEQEEARWSNGEMISPIRTFLLEALDDGQPWSLDRLKQRAEEKNLNLQTSRPGSALHGALVAMKRSGLVEIMEKGVWKLIDKNAPPGQPSEAL